MQSVGGSEGGSAHFENVWGIEKNRPREQKKHVLQTLAEVRVGSAHFENVWGIEKIARVSRKNMICRLWRK